MAEIKDFARMCNSYYQGVCSYHGVCSKECPLRYLVDRCNVVINCADFMRLYPKEADRIITEWCKEHPQKTYLQDFLEKFPGAGLKDDGLPLACRMHLYDTCKCTVCKDCWNEVMPDE